jgi:hypothetical protein
MRSARQTRIAVPDRLPRAAERPGPWEEEGEEGTLADQPLDRGLRTRESRVVEEVTLGVEEGENLDQQGDEEVDHL